MFSRTLRRTLPLLVQPSKAAPTSLRAFTTSPRLLSRPPRDDTYAKQETSRPLNPSLDNKTSTLHPDSPVPSVGAHNAPPHLLSAVDPSPSPQAPQPHKQQNKHSSPKTYHTDAEVTSHLHSSFSIPPLARHNEDPATIRARLLYQSRKRGILETDLLLSTFADENLPHLTLPQLHEYDKFLDENDWDIYYWCTQQTPSTSAEYAEGGPPITPETAASAAGKDPKQQQQPELTSPQNPANKTLIDFITTDAAHPGSPNEDRKILAAGMDTGGAGEWAQTVGRKKEPYRRPPERWAESEILGMIRRHVEERKAGRGIKGEEGQGGEVGKGKGEMGLGRMPPVRSFEGVSGGSVVE